MSNSTEELNYLTRDLIDQFIELRRIRRLTQDECNDLLGVADRLVSKWECGTRVPKLFHLCCWADVLNAQLVLVPYDDDETLRRFKVANDNDFKIVD